MLAQVHVVLALVLARVVLQRQATRGAALYSESASERAGRGEGIGITRISLHRSAQAAQAPATRSLVGLACCSSFCRTVKTEFLLFGSTLAEASRVSRHTSSLGEANVVAGVKRGWRLGARSAVVCSGGLSVGTGSCFCEEGQEIVESTAVCVNTQGCPGFEIYSREEVVGQRWLFPYV